MKLNVGISYIRIVQLAWISKLGWDGIGDSKKNFFVSRGISSTAREPLIIVGTQSEMLCNDVLCVDFRLVSRVSSLLGPERSPQITTPCLSVTASSPHECLRCLCSKRCLQITTPRRRVEFVGCRFVPRVSSLLGSCRNQHCVRRSSL